MLCVIDLCPLPSLSPSLPFPALQVSVIPELISWAKSPLGTLVKLDILKNLVINYFRDGKNVFYFVGFPIFHLTFSLWKITGFVFQTVNKCLQVDFEALPTCPHTTQHWFADLLHPSAMSSACAVLHACSVIFQGRGRSFFLIIAGAPSVKFF